MPRDLHLGAAFAAWAPARRRGSWWEAAWTRVRVRGGEAVLEDVVVGGVPIRERLRRGEGVP